MKQFMRQRQQGMTFIGLLCILVLAGAVVYAGIRLVPVYLNYMNIVKTMETTASEFKGESADPGSRDPVGRYCEIVDWSVLIGLSYLFGGEELLNQA